MRAVSDKPVLVTGGAGFIGSNLADRLAAQGRKVRIFDALSRDGVERNLEWLTNRHGDLIEVEIADLRDEQRLRSAVSGSDGIFHFAAQVAVTTSMTDPVLDFEVNVASTFRLLEAVRELTPQAPVIFASTNKVYGDLEDIAFQTTERGCHPADADLARDGVSESRPLDFHTPYGCSKGAADQYVLDYARSYGLRAAVLRMSCIYGQRQLGTEDQGWVAHFLIRALKGETITLFGDGEQVRDICDVADTCDAYLAAYDRIDAISGRAFNWGGGPDNAISLLSLLKEIGTITGEMPKIAFAESRPGDQRWFVADTSAADRALGLNPRKPWKQGVRDLSQWLMENRTPAEEERIVAPRQVAVL